MPATDLERELRPATLDDAALVADLESKRDPQEPRDPVMLRYWWQMGDELERAMRRVRVREESAIAFLGVSHDLWLDGEKRFGVIRPLLRYEEWRDDDYALLVDIGARCAAKAPRPQSRAPGRTFRAGWVCSCDWGSARVGECGRRSWTWSRAATTLPRRRSNLAAGCRSKAS
jgi:hypothetical protein